MTQRIKLDDLSEFDAAPYLDSETSIAAYLRHCWPLRLATSRVPAG